MRSLAVILVFCLQGLLVAAQVSVGPGEMPDERSSILYSKTDFSGPDIHEISGSGVTWDYSFLEPQIQVYDNYRPAREINLFFLSIPGGFGNKVNDSLGIGQFQVRNINNIYRVRNSGMNVEARSLEFNGLPLPQFYEDIDELYQFPLRYGDLDSSTFLVRFNLLNQFSLIQNGTRVVNVEGEGRLVTPGNTYERCLKVRSDVFEIDTIKILELPAIPIPRQTTRYSWFVPGVKGPVLEVIGNVVLGFFIPNEIRFQDIPRSLIGFEADRYRIPINDVVSVWDTTQIPFNNRKWTITSRPEHTFHYGTGETDENIFLSFNDTGFVQIELTGSNRFGDLSELRSRYIEVYDDTVVYNGTEFQDFLIYPNPSKDNIIIGAYKVPDRVNLYNVLGQPVREFGGSRLISLVGLTAGQYVMKIRFGETEILRTIQKN